MDIELYAALTDSIEYALDEADSAAKESKVRFSPLHDEKHRCQRI